MLFSKVRKYAPPAAIRNIASFASPGADFIRSFSQGWSQKSHSSRDLSSGNPTFPIKKPALSGIV